MTTETTAEAATQTTAQAADTSAEAAKAGEAGATLLTATDDASKTAEGVEAGDKSAETGDGEKAKEGEAKAKTDDAKAEGPPEKYEFTMPEGMELDTVLAEKVDPVLRDLGLNNEQANKLASTFAEYRASEAQRQSDAYAQQVEDWGQQARDDKEFGGATFEKNVTAAQKAIGQFGTPELKTLLADGLGNHPELIRFCVRVGKAIGEDGGIDAKSSSTPRDPTSVLYDNPTSKR